MSKKSINDIRVPTYDDLFTNEEQRQEAKLEKIMEIPVEDIQEFKNHPFRVRNDEQMSELVKSVSANGILVPVLVRPKSPPRACFRAQRGSSRACRPRRCR